MEDLDLQVKEGLPDLLDHQEKLVHLEIEALVDLQEPLETVEHLVKFLWGKCILCFSYHPPVFLINN